MHYTLHAMVEFEADTEVEARDFAELLDGARLAYLGDAYDGHDATLRAGAGAGDSLRAGD